MNCIKSAKIFVTGTPSRKISEVDAEDVPMSAAFPMQASANTGTNLPAGKHWAPLAVEQLTKKIVTVDSGHLGNWVPLRNMEPL